MPNGYASSPPDPSQSDSRPEVTLWVSMKFMYPLASAGYPVFPGGGILGCRHVNSTSYSCFEKNHTPRGPPHGQRRNKEDHTLPSCHAVIPTRLVSSLLSNPSRDEAHSCTPPLRLAHSDPSVLALLKDWRFSLRSGILDTVLGLLFALVVNMPAAAAADL